MRILHTADWHLGKIVNEYSMLEVQQAVLDQLVDDIKERDIDVVVMAGDLYDRSIPPKEAIRLANDILTRLSQEVKVPVILTSGNHDSPDRIEYGSRLFAGSGVYNEGIVKKSCRKVSIKEADFYLFPFGDPIFVREVLEDPEIRTMEDAMRIQIEEIRQCWDPKRLNIAVAHGYFIGSSQPELETTDSERPLSIGASEYVNADLFDGFDYVALGHLHKAQKVKNERIRYSGSIAKYSKSECTNKKQALLVDLDEAHIEVTPLPLQAPYDMQVLRGKFEDLMRGAAEDYLFFELEDSHPVLDAMTQLKKRYPRAMGLEYLYQRESSSVQLLHDSLDLKQRTMPELFADFYRQFKQDPLTEKEKELVTALFEEAERRQQ